jgi:hypothetical protein
MRRQSHVRPRRARGASVIVVVRAEERVAEKRESERERERVFVCERDFGATSC